MWMDRTPPEARHNRMTPSFGSSAGASVAYWDVSPLDIPVAGRSSLPGMKLSEVAEKVGVSAKAIRFYEAAGVLPPAQRAANRYREYTESDLCRLRIVVTLRGLGLDLPESGRLATLCAEDRCDDMRGDFAGRLAERRREVSAARAELDHLDAELAAAEQALQCGDPQPSLCLGKEERIATSVRLPIAGLSV
jgi:MerR family copper efflux transcriptional regulator